MKIGFGITALSKGRRDKKLDGIARYTDELLCALNETKALESIVEFDLQNSPNASEGLWRSHGFRNATLKSLILGQEHPISRNIDQLDLFHSTDHYIPNLKSTKCVATIHDVIPFTHPDLIRMETRLLVGPIFKRTLRFAQHIVTISDHSKQQIERVFGLSEEKITVIPNGINPWWFKSSYRKLVHPSISDFVNENQFFLAVGTITPRKNYLRLIEAFEALPTELRKKFKLLIVGKEGWKTQETLSAISRYDNVLNFSTVNDEGLKFLYENCEMFLHPSLAEGFGLPVLEAMAVGKRVVCSDIPSVREFGRNNPIYFAPDDSSSIACSIEKCLNEEPSRREAKIREGKQIAKCLTWLNTALATVDMYKKISKEST